MIDDKAIPALSLASISWTQQNRNQEDMSQKETTTRKEQVQDPAIKYIPPHLRKVDNTQVSKKRRSKLTVPLATTKGKSQPKTLNLKGIIEDRNAMILVDSTGTYNCIDINVAKQLNILCTHKGPHNDNG
jgi:hypothetical protein